MYLRVAIADHFVMTIMQSLERAWSWSSERLKDMSDHIPHMVERGRGVLFPLPFGLIDRVRRVGVRRIVSETNYSPVRGPATFLCSCNINWERPDVVSLYPYDITWRSRTPCRRDVVNKGGRAQVWCHISEWSRLSKMGRII